jgi:arylsulfatase
MLSLLTVLLGALAPIQEPRPDIVVILADDLGWSDVGCYGGEIETPNLDALAAGGVRFTQFYNTGRCCPTRAALLTGLYAHQAGVGHMMEDRGSAGYRGDLNERCVTIAQVLRGAGYATCIAGKWHVTKQTGHWTGKLRYTSKHNWPLQRGFERFFGTIWGAGSYFDPSTLTRDNDPIDTPAGEFYYTDAISDAAAAFVSEHSKEQPDQPLFCYVAYTAPHWPLHALQADIARVGRRYERGWDAVRQARLARQRELGLIDEAWPLTARDPRVPAWEDAPDRDWQGLRMAVYAAQIEAMDRGIGRIVEALRAAGRLDNTLLLFLADNGGCAEEIGEGAARSLSIPARARDGGEVAVGNSPLRAPGPEHTYQSYGIGWANASNTPLRLYKHFVHEGGIATPCIAHWPARIARAGALVADPAHVIDVMATCIDIAGAKYPAQHGGHPILPPEGISLLPAFSGEPLARAEPLFFEHEGHRAVRRGKWKLVARGAKGKWELYDMQRDRTELRDLAQEEREVVAELSAAWDAWAKRCGVE